MGRANLEPRAPTTNAGRGTAPDLALRLRRWVFRWTLRRKLMLAIVLSLLPMAALFAWSVSERAAVRRGTELDANGEIAEAVAAAFAAHMRDIDHQLVAMGLALGWRFELDNPAVVQAYLTLNRANYADVVLLAFLDPAGEVVAADPPTATGARLGGEYYVVAALSSRNTVISDVFPSPDGGAWWAVTRGVLRANGELAGVLVAYLDPTALDSALRFDRLMQASVAILDRRGQLAYHSQRATLPWSERDWTRLPSERQARPGRGASAVEFVDPFEGTPHLGATAPVENFGWGVVAYRPMAEIMAPIEQAALREAGIFALVLLFNLVGAAALALTFTRPLRQLNAGLAEVERGRYGSRVAVQGSDEVAALARRFNAMAERLQDLEGERQAFAAMVAHDLRSPLTAIRGTAQILQRQLRRGTVKLDALDRGLETVVRETDRVAHMAAELGDAAHATAGQLDLRPSATDLVVIAREAVERLSASGLTQPVRFTAESPAAPLEADPDRLARVFDNLLGNAAKYSAADAPIEVRVWADDQAHASVQDHGAGIPPDELPRLFERYFRARGARVGREGGLGLGLYISHEIVVAHGGRLSVESQPGVGSRFIIDLPLGAERPPSDPPSDAAQALTAVAE